MQATTPEVGLVLEITGLCAFVVPSSPNRPVRLLCMGADPERDVPVHRPHLLFRVRDVGMPSATPDHVLELGGETYALWSLEGAQMTIEGDGEARARPRLLASDSDSPEALGFWNSVPDHLVDMGKLVGPTRISPRAASRVAAAALLGGGDRGLLAGLPPRSGQPVQFQFDPPGQDPGYRPFLTDLVVYSLQGRNISILLRTVRGGYERHRDRIIVLREGGRTKGYLQDAPPSLVTHGPGTTADHFAAFFGLLDGPASRLTPPKLVAVGDQGVLSDTSFCPPAFFVE
jgi:hypothetical protein